MQADFHAVTVSSCQCMSNSSPCGSALLAVMNSSQGRQVKLQYLLNFKTRESINEGDHWLISVECCLTLPLFSCSLQVVICYWFSRNQPLLSMMLPTCCNRSCMLLGMTFCQLYLYWEPFWGECRAWEHVEHGSPQGLAINSVACAALTASNPLAFWFECLWDCTGDLLFLFPVLPRNVWIHSLVGGWAAVYTCVCVCRADKEQRHSENSLD